MAPQSLSITDDDDDNDDDDDDDDDDDNQLSLWNGRPTKGIKPYFQPGPLSDALAFTNLRAACMI